MVDDRDLIDIISGFIWFMPLRGVITFIQAVSAVVKYFGRRRKRNELGIRGCIKKMESDFGIIDNYFLTDLACPIQDAVEEDPSLASPVTQITNSLRASSLRGVKPVDHVSLHPLIAYCRAASDLTRKTTENLCIKATNSAQGKELLDSAMQILEITKTIEVVTRKVREYSNHSDDILKDVSSVDLLLNDVMHMEVARRLLKTYGCAFISSRFSDHEYLSDPRVLKALYQEHLEEYLRDREESDFQSIGEAFNLQKEEVRTLIDSLSEDGPDSHLVLRNKKIWSRNLARRRLADSAMGNAEDIVDIVNQWGMDPNTASQLLLAEIESATHLPSA